MAQVKIELVYPDNSKQEHTIEVRLPDRRSKTLDAIEKAVHKKFASDKLWTRWNLLAL